MATAPISPTCRCRAWLRSRSCAAPLRTGASAPLRCRRATAAACSSPPTSRSQNRSSRWEPRPDSSIRNIPRLLPTRSASWAIYIGVCVAPTRAEAEDIAQSCSIDFEELPAIWDIDVALAAGATPIHDGWTDNIVAQTMIETGDLEAVRTSAPVTVHKSLRMERHAGVSLECRGVLALLGSPARRAHRLPLHPGSARQCGSGSRRRSACPENARCA